MKIRTFAHAYIKLLSSTRTHTHTPIIYIYLYIKRRFLYAALWLKKQYFIYSNVVWESFSKYRADVFIAVKIWLSIDWLQVTTASHPIPPIFSLCFSLQMLFYIRGIIEIYIFIFIYIWMRKIFWLYTHTKNKRADRINNI